ncbi:PVC-type heme-binding CxxCH protein [Flavihumibacter petaseus]|uniref:Putative oxidoreductase n=1 Tax=Flavihumibacter petaseus NBRC 106054 TaxID=1220578 RepID=A0A0E9MZN5_9BACT|nr:PVC-type heme-binding CxxCH protein [Flavihumibacter petaseus]GAO42988.1 putative oxidoreductase [Flavihumibacter petaseus NBRC 106054]
MPIQLLRNPIILCFTCLLAITACQSPESNTSTTTKTDTLTEEQKHLPENALRGLTVAEGLVVTPFAEEPMLQNPTNMDVDDRGRVWITEAYNYRPAINGNPTNALGDRIVILEDTNGDGQADTSKVFYQGPELNAPLGIAVLGNRVIISQSPYIWSFYDSDGDDKADRKEILFQGIGGEQHDHGAHAVTFGPDGKLYFNFGNEARTLKDAKGKVILDGKQYRQGLTLRCNPDGSQVEVLAENFRNPYEVAVDSYGALWQSDNDDDGNKGTRINAIFPHGKYGYTDEMTGAGWQSNRTNMEDSIPLRHWHLNDPGVVPNLLQTGAGSPTGMVVYEGNLFPERFHGQLIHCDAGPNVVRSYQVQAAGAGYTANTENILKGDKDPWFRPADICVAPDGSLMVADWYDPGVGGHAAGDQVRGRVYRVAPKGHPYKTERYNYKQLNSAMQALESPNLATRYLAYTALLQMGDSATAALQQHWKQTGAGPRMRARAFWILLDKDTKNEVSLLREAATDDNSNIRSMAIRAAVTKKSIGLDTILPALVNDRSAEVRREAALALYHYKGADGPSLWTTLANAHDGIDRWYLEALGIGAEGQWGPFFSQWLTTNQQPLATAAGRDIIWRARTDKAIPLLAQLAADNNTPLQNRLRYFRAFDFLEGRAKYPALLKLLEQQQGNSLEGNRLVLQALDIPSVRSSPVAMKALDQVLDSLRGTAAFIEMTGRYKVKHRNSELLQMAVQKSKEPLGRDAASCLLQQDGTPSIKSVINGKDTAASLALLRSLAGVGNTASLDILQNVVTSKQYDSTLRKAAAGMIGWSWSGEERVLTLLKAGKVPKQYIPLVVQSVGGAWRGSVKEEAASYLPEGSQKDGTTAPPAFAELKALKGDIAAGHTVFTSKCGLCHKAGTEGFDFGPALSEIGSKLPKEELYRAITQPSAGISFGYEGWELKLKDGSSLSGILSSKTETDLEIKFPGGSKQQLKTSSVKTMTQLKKSMMTDNLYQQMSLQDMANLLDYLGSLKKH